MDKKELISEYVERVFELYGLNKFEFFYDIDDDSESLDRFAIPLFVEGFESEEETIFRVSQYLGLTPEEIINRDKLAALKYWDKFPFFSLHNDFIDSWVWNAQYKNSKPTAEDMLLGALFDIPLGEARYDFKSVTERFHEQLKVAAEYDPDYYPSDSRLHVLKVDTREMFSFPECGEMIRSYLDMIYRAQSLFFRALQEDLSDAEQREYNFLASYLMIEDIARPTRNMYYCDIVRLRDVLLEEGYKEFWSYVKIKNPLTLREPWRCIEFFNNMGLVQEFINAFPSAKKEMIEFARLVKNFRFSFQWELIKSQEEKDEEFVQAYLAGLDYDENYNPNPVLSIYVEKTREEISDFEAGLEKLRLAASPPAMGGVTLPERELKNRGFDTQAALRISRHILGR